MDLFIIVSVETPDRGGMFMWKLCPDMLSIIAICVFLLWKRDTSTRSYTVLRSSPSFPCAFFDSIVFTFQSHCVFCHWYDRPNTLTWPLCEKLMWSWTWHRRDGLVFVYTLTNVSPFCSASEQCFFEREPQSPLVMSENLMANCPPPGAVLEDCMQTSGRLLSSFGSQPVGFTWFDMV